MDQTKEWRKITLGDLYDYWLLKTEAYLDTVNSDTPIQDKEAHIAEIVGDLLSNMDYVHPSSHQFAFTVLTAIEQIKQCIFEEISQVEQLNDQGVEPVFDNVTRVKLAAAKKRHLKQLGLIAD